MLVEGGAGAAPPEGAGGFGPRHGISLAQHGGRMAAMLRLRRESGSGCRSRGGERGRPSPPHSRLLLPSPLPPSLDGRGEMQHHTEYFRIIPMNADKKSVQHRHSIIVAQLY